MGVKVVLERAVRAGYENTVLEKLWDLRSRAYMYGETWPIDGIVDSVNSSWF